MSRQCLDCNCDLPEGKWQVQRKRCKECSDKYYNAGWDRWNMGFKGPCSHCGNTCYGQLCSSCRDIHNFKNSKLDKFKKEINSAVVQAIRKKLDTHTGSPEDFIKEAYIILYKVKQVLNGV